MNLKYKAACAVICSILVFNTVLTVNAEPDPEGVTSSVYSEDNGAADKLIQNSNEISDSEIIQEEVIQESKLTDEESQNIDVSAEESINQEQFQQEIDYIECLKGLKCYKAEYNEDLDLRNAVLRFQSENNLEVDGIFGNHSMTVLRKRLQDEEFIPSDTVSNPPSKGKWIVINLSKRILTLYENAMIVKKYPIAVGNPPSLTPVGKFTIVYKEKNPAWGGGGYANPVAGGSPYNPLGYRWMGLSVGGGGAYGIHGNNSPYSIGTNVSHGCIRMINSDVENLYDMVTSGTIVWIGNEINLASWGVIQNYYCEPE